MHKTFSVDVFHIPERKKLRLMVSAKTSGEAIRKANRLFNVNHAALVSKAEYLAYGVRGAA